MECELKRVEQDGLIELDTESKYNSPLICIRKPNGKLRLVNNFIKLNEKTVKDHYDTKKANEIIYRVAGASYISVIDLAKFFIRSNYRLNVDTILRFTRRLARFIITF